jgi:membrane protease YdiL (CAAX protease family)
MENQKTDAEIEQTEVPQKKWINYPFWDLILEIIVFFVFCLCIAVAMAVIFVLIFGWDYVFENYSNISSIMLGPSLFGAFILWVAITKRKSFKEIFMGIPKFPEKGHRWFYYFFVITWLLLFTAFLVSLVIGWTAFIATPSTVGWGIYSFFWAAFGEEVYFRGYFYLRSEDVYGRGRFFFEWKFTKRNDEGRFVGKTFMTFEITYPAIFTSIIFAAAHLSLSPISLLLGFVGGLFFCKFRNETNSLIIAMIFHWMYDFGTLLLNYTLFLVPLPYPFNYFFYSIL